MARDILKGRTGRVGRFPQARVNIERCFREDFSDYLCLYSNGLGTGLCRVECLYRKEPTLATSAIETGQYSGPDKDAGKHGAIEASGVGVAQRGVVAAEQMNSIGECIAGAVGEVVGGLALDDALCDEMGEVTVKGDLAQADDDADSSKLTNLVGEVRGAVANLLWRGLVSRWSAADDGGDPGITEPEAIVAGDPFGLAGEAGLVKNGVHEVTGSVAGEGTACAVGAMRSGSESEDEDAGAGIAEAGNGACPVDLVLVGAALGLADSPAVGTKTRTSFAGDDGFMDLENG